MRTMAACQLWRAITTLTTRQVLLLLLLLSLCITSLFDC